MNLWQKIFGGVGICSLVFALYAGKGHSESGSLTQADNSAVSKTGADDTTALEDKIDTELTFENAKNNTKIRQAYLGQILEDNKGNSFIAELAYEENPKMFAIKKMIEYGLDKKEKGLTVMHIDGEKLQNAYAYVISEPSEFGKKKKSTAYVFPKIFELTGDEFAIVLSHENKHAKDIYDGIKLGKETFDAEKLTMYEEILELRASYAILDCLLKISQGQGKEFLEKVRLSFIQEREGEYVSAYNNLKNALESDDLKSYEADVVKKHLFALDQWIEADKKYVEK